ncbi:MAG: glycosyltransferase [Phycisphaerales bacterium]|nr:MAG: glycosyltransferase [Phycisphaerales bacterium]
MRIAFVTSYLDDRFGGPVTVVKKLGEALADAGHEISYWAPGEDGADGNFAPSGASVHLCGHSWPRSWYRSRRLPQALSSSLHSIDLVHISELWSHPIYAASRVARAKGVPYILRPAGSLEPWGLSSGYLKSLKKRLYIGLVGRSIMERAACLQAASEREAESVRRIGYRGPVTVIPNGVDLDHASPGCPTEADRYWPDLKDRPVVLFMSRLSPEKGLDLLIPLWADLVKMRRFRDAILMVAGPDYRGYARTVESLTRRHQVESCVRTIGMLQGEEKLALLRRADVFVLPSYSDSFGIVVAEALACGTPVVTTTGTPWGRLETVDAGRCVSPTKPALTDALCQLLDLTPSQRHAMGQRGRALIEAEHTWDKIAVQFLRLCDCILKGMPIPLHA